MILRQKWFVLLFLILPSVYAFGARADSPKYPPYSGHVNDFSNVIDPATKQQMETILLNFEQRTGAQIAVVTIPSLNGVPIEDYANGLYRAWGIGAKTGENKDKGLLLLIATQDRRSRLEVGYGLEGDMPDGLSGELLRRMRPYFQQQQWSQGLMTGVQTILATLAKAWNVSLDGIDQRFAYDPRATRDQGHFPILLLIVLGVFLIMFIAAIINRRGGGGPGGGRRSNSLWWLAPLIFNQGGGGMGGGAWGGGGDSGGGGGGWGGFGGGSSGGGGASDSW
jgi:uncharacterized protein